MPYAIIPPAIMETWPRLSDKTKAVVVAIASFMDGQEKCYPGRDRIMERAGITRPNSFADALKELRQFGLITTRRRYQNSTVYAWTDVTRNDTYRNAIYNGKRRAKVTPNDTLRTKGSIPEDNTVQNGNGNSTSRYSFPLKNGDTWTLPEGKLDEYRENFNQVDVETELVSAKQWLLDNPGRRKTAKGMPKFLSGWLRRATQSNSQPKSKRTPQPGDDDFVSGGKTEAEWREIEKKREKDGTYEDYANFLRKQGNDGQ